MALLPILRRPTSSRNYRIFCGCSYKGSGRTNYTKPNSELGGLTWLASRKGKLVDKE